MALAGEGETSTSNNQTPTKQDKVKVSTLMMYRNGCIKICGLKSVVEAIDPYVFITSWLDEHPSCILQL